MCLWVSRLAQLIGLRQLALEYEGPFSVSAAAATAAAWGHLPQLKALRVPVSSNQQQNARLFSGAAAATSLTALWVDGSAAHEAALAAQLLQLINHQPVQHIQNGIAVCSSLTRLMRLQNLVITYVPLVPADALALTALTGLALLLIGDVGAGVDDATATALASSLTQLRSLTLHNCRLSVACMAAIAQLTQLTEVRVFDDMYRWTSR
jgi:hypothetical protein